MPLPVFGFSTNIAVPGRPKQLQDYIAEAMLQGGKLGFESVEQDELIQSRKELQAQSDAALAERQYQADKRAPEVRFLTSLALGETVPTGENEDIYKRALDLGLQPEDFTFEHNGQTYMSSADRANIATQTRTRHMAPRLEGTVEGILGQDFQPDMPAFRYNEVVGDAETLLGLQGDQAQMAAAAAQRRLAQAQQDALDASALMAVTNYRVVYSDGRIELPNTLAAEVIRSGVNGEPYSAQAKEYMDVMTRQGGTIMSTAELAKSGLGLGSDPYMDSQYVTLTTKSGTPEFNYLTSAIIEGVRTSPIPGLKGNQNDGNLLPDYIASDNGKMEDLLASGLPKGIAAWMALQFPGGVADLEDRVANGQSIPLQILYRALPAFEGAPAMAQWSNLRNFLGGVQATSGAQPLMHTGLGTFGDVLTPQEVDRYYKDGSGTLAELAASKLLKRAGMPATMGELTISNPLLAGMANRLYSAAETGSAYEAMSAGLNYQLDSGMTSEEVKSNVARISEDLLNGRTDTYKAYLERVFEAAKNENMFTMSQAEALADAYNMIEDPEVALALGGMLGTLANGMGGIEEHQMTQDTTVTNTEVNRERQREQLSGLLEQ